MIDPGIDAHLELMRENDRISVRAYVAEAPPRLLRWTLETVSNSEGGTSRVSQSGHVHGGSGQPVAATSVSPESRGIVTFSIFDGVREVAREETVLAPGLGDRAE